MRKKIGNFLLLIFLIMIIFQANAQTPDPMVSPGAFDMSTSPQWARDLRRGSIVTFGSFPFTFFFTGFIMDTSRFISNDYDQRYAPAPFKSAGSIDMTRDQQLMRIGIAAASSIVIGLIDYIIVRNNRIRQSRELNIIEPDPPLIIRTPIVSAEVWELPPVTEDQILEDQLEEQLFFEQHEIEADISEIEINETDIDETESNIVETDA